MNDPPASAAPTEPCNACGGDGRLLVGHFRGASTTMFVLHGQVPCGECKGTGIAPRSTSVPPKAGT